MYIQTFTCSRPLIQILMWQIFMIFFKKLMGLLDWAQDHAFSKSCNAC